MKITYTTDDPTIEYIAALEKAKNIRELRTAVAKYRVFAADALKIVNKMNGDDFKNFKKDWKKAEKEQPAEWIEKFNERFGIVVMPIKLLVASLVAEKCHAPWGCAFIRCKQEKWPMLKK